MAKQKYCIVLILQLFLQFIIANENIRRSDYCSSTPLQTDYTGTINVTVSGKTCQMWNSQSPHTHYHNRWINDANYCRNQNNPTGAWCLTTDPDVRWEICNVPRCDVDQVQFCPAELKHLMQSRGTCQYTCHCKDQCKFDPVNGSCYSGCDAGWTGPTCQQVNATYCTLEQRHHCGENNNCGCKYLCHCNVGDSCDPSDGTCESGTCTSGWMGKSCQFANIAFNQPTRPIDDTLVDGDRSTCSREIRNVSLHLNERYPLSALVIVLKEGSISQLQITVKAKANPKFLPNVINSVCFSGRVPVRDRQVLVFCAHVLRGDQLNIEFDQTLSVCEIEVYGGKNVAVWQSTSQYGVYMEKDHAYPASLAVDGTTSAKLESGTCTHTKHTDGNEQPWWKITLDSMTTVTRAKLYIRKDFHENRMLGFNISVNDDNNVIYQQHKNLSSGVIDIVEPFPLTIHSLKVTIPTGPDRFISLCEVQIFACLPRRNGTENCKDFCPLKCSDNNNCVNQNFECNRCQNGWCEPFCSQDIDKCSTPNLCNNGSCHKTSCGYHCQCDPGYTGPNCQNDIDECLTRNWCNNGSCSNVPGSYDCQCHSGYTGLNCQNDVTCNTTVFSHPLKLNYSTNVVVLHGKTLLLTCDLGYKLLGNSSTTCQNDGSWDNIPTCKVNATYCTLEQKLSCSGNTDCSCKCLCHCKVGGTCDPHTGTCGSDHCFPGWMGKSCQFANIAYNKDSGLTANTLVDGDRNTCNETTSVSINLKDQYPLSALVIVINEDTNAIKVSVRTKEESSSNSSNSICFNNQVAVENKEIVIYCTHVLRGCRLNITFQKKIKVCEIEVYGGRNIALWKTTTQFGLFPNTSDLAVDGNTTLSSAILTRSNSEMSIKGSWWQINLNSPTTVTRIKLYINDQPHMPNINVSLDNNTVPILLYRQNRKMSNGIINILDHLPKIIKSIKIMFDNSADRILPLSEVEVFACIPSRDGDENCQGFCPPNCNETDCVRSNFECSECKSNWTGPFCRYKQCESIRVSNMNFTKSLFSEENLTQTTQFSCHKGYNPPNETYATCNTNGQWTPKIPECTQILTNVQTASKTGIIVGSVGALLVVGLVVAIAVVIMIIRRRRISKGVNERPEIQMDEISKSHLYSNIQKIESTKEYTDKRLPERVSGGDNANDTNPPKNVYYEIADGRNPKSLTEVSVKEFKDVLENRRMRMEYYSVEFEKLKSGLQFPFENAVTITNRPKNKYKNIYPYDHTRVILSELEDEPGSDYINATHIHGFRKQKIYIAAQGPIAGTIKDFWRMIWQEDVRKIVMLTNLYEEGKYKCAQYWPEDEDLRFPGLTLKLLDTERFADFRIRTMSLSDEETRRTIQQFHYTAWPDRGTPTYSSSLVNFASKVRHTSVPGKGPLVVHCSAGVGRTGTFIALENLVKQGEDTGFVDVFRCVQVLRDQRLNMVQTLNQYIFLHHTLLEALMSPACEIPSSEFPSVYADLLEYDKNLSKRKIDLAFQTLNETSPVIPESEYAVGKASIRRKKNRYSNIIPVNSKRPILVETNEDDGYINAVFVPSYRKERNYIITQMPLQDTVLDFWRLIHDHSVSTIVMMNNLPEEELYANSATVGIYWPSVKETMTVGQFHIETSTEEESETENDFDIVHLKYRYKNEESRSIRLFQAKFWEESETVPSSTLPMLNFLEATDIYHQSHNTGPMVVHCMNGCTRSGLFCVVQAVLERLKIDQDVRIQHVVKQMRSCRPQIISNVEQFQYCHELVLEFLNQFGEYSNFQ